MNGEIESSKPRQPTLFQERLVLLETLPRRVREVPAAPSDGDVETYASGQNIVALAGISRTWWFLSNGSVFHLRYADDELVYSRYSAEHGLPDYQYTAMTVDRFGRVWLGSRQNGIVIRNAGAWQGMIAADGLPSNRIDYLMTDMDNTVWLSCDKGIYSAPAGELSAGWRKLDPTSCQPPQLRANVIVANPDGAVFLGTDWGLFHIGPTRRACRRITMRDGLPSNQVTALSQVGSQSLWVGTTTGLALYHNGEISTPFLDQKPIQHIAYDEKSRSYWFASRTELWRLKEDILQSWPLSTQRQADSVVRALVSDGNEQVWMGLDTGLVELSPRNEVLKVDSCGEPPTGEVSAIAIDALGYVWALATSGMHVFRQRVWSVLQSSQLLGPLLNARQLVTTPDHFVWVSAWAKPQGGVRRLKSRTSTAVELLIKGGQLDSADAIALGDAGKIWAAEGARILRHDGERWEEFTSSPDPNSLIRTIHIHNGTLWCGTSSGLYVRALGDADDAIWRPICTDGEFRALVRGRDGRLWAGGSTGLYLVIDQVAGKIHRYADCDVWALCIDPSDVVWIGASDGLLCLRWTDEDCPAQQPAHYRRLLRRVTALAVDKEGTLWIGTQSGTLSLKNSSQRAESLLSN